MSVHGNPVSKHTVINQSAERTRPLRYATAHANACYSLYWFSPGLRETWCYRTTSKNETGFHNEQNTTQNSEYYSTTVTFNGKMACHLIKGTNVSTKTENTVPQSAFKLNSAPAAAETLHLQGQVLRVNHNIMTTSLHKKFKLGSLLVCQYILLIPFQWKRNAKV